MIVSYKYILMPYINIYIDLYKRFKNSNLVGDLSQVTKALVIIPYWLNYCLHSQTNYVYFLRLNLSQTNLLSRIWKSYQKGRSHFKYVSVLSFWHFTFFFFFFFNNHIFYVFIGLPKRLQDKLQWWPLQFLQRNLFCSQTNKLHHEHTMG
jgi:hypothetical protein